MTAPSPVQPRIPSWLAEIHSCLPVTRQFLITGNIADDYTVPDADGDVTPVSLPDALWRTLQRSGFDALITIDPIDLAHVHAASTADTGKWLPEVARKTYLERLEETARQIANDKQQRRALLIQYASRITVQPNALNAAERHFFLAMEKLANESTQSPKGVGRAVPVYNAIFWALDRDRDIPPVFARSQAVRVISVPMPDYRARTEAAALYLGTNRAFDAASLDTQQDVVRRLGGQSDGLTLRSIRGVTTLIRKQAVPLDRVEDAVRTIKLGVVENPWRDAADRIKKADEDLGKRVRGQTQAIHRAVDILMRSSTGLTGAYAEGGAQRPRGVLFFAGPTGVGKTELAKTITELVFGDKECYTRFDMSPFASEHAGDRLIGAPPGYVGFAAGGELTNAVRTRPFSLILFDEIEKAHPRILDKFLQVLEDGRLTDGTGSTVHFSECILVFTSNLGLFTTEQHGGRLVRTPNPAAAYDQCSDKVEEAIRNGIEDFFTVEIQRPELLNRLGDNIVIFQYIRTATAELILDHMLENVDARLSREHGVHLSVSASARSALLKKWAIRPELGGRGVGSVVETALLNPLSRHVFMSPPELDTQLLTISQIDGSDGIWTAEWEGSS